MSRCCVVEQPLENVMNNLWTVAQERDVIPWYVKTFTAAVLGQNLMMMMMMMMIIIRIRIIIIKLIIIIITATAASPQRKPSSQGPSKLCAAARSAWHTRAGTESQFQCRLGLRCHHNQCT